MSKFALEPGGILRYGMAVFAGVFLTLAFPNPSVAGLGWLVPGLILAAGMGSSPGQAFRIGYVAGFVHYLSSLYWLLHMPVNAIRFVGWIALAFYLAFYMAIWVWLCWRILPVGVMGRSVHLRDVLGRFSEVGWFPRFCWAVACATIWVALEMTRARLFTGFPWNLLGVSQFQVLPLIQVSSITGVYGVSFLVCWFSVGLFCAATMLLGAGRMGWRWVRELMVPMLVIVLVVSAGSRRLFRQEPPEKTIKVLMVQPSIPQTMIWDGRENASRFERLLKMTEQAMTNKPDVVMWPESAVPGWFRLDREVLDPVSDLVRTNGVWLVLEAEDAQYRDGPRNERDSYNYYNSSFLMGPNGTIEGDYRKRKLVVFGEYIPLVRWLPFMTYLTPIGSGFTAGEEATSFNMTSLGVKSSVLICFEDAFPHLAPDGVDSDTDFLINLTNDGWFSESAAQWQHAANAAFRAVENGLPLLRVTNNGLTCWIDGMGRRRGMFRDETGSAYGEGIYVVEIPVLGGKQRNATFYSGRGDWFGWACVTCSVLALGLGLAGRRSELS